MRIALDTPGGRRVRDIRGSRAALQRALDTLSRVADADVAAGVGDPYSLGIRYRRERGEEWRRPFVVAGAGEGDCEDLAAWVAAVRRAEGTPARAELVPGGARSLHAIVRYPDGDVEDPSVFCGMTARLLTAPRCRFAGGPGAWRCRVYLPAGYLIIAGDGRGANRAEAYAEAVDVALAKTAGYGVAVEGVGVGGVGDGDAFERIGEVADLLRTEAERAAADALGGTLGDALGSAEASGWVAEARETIGRAIDVFNTSDAAARERRAPDRLVGAIIAAGVSYSGARSEAQRRIGGVAPVTSSWQLPPFREDWDRVATARDRMRATWVPVLVAARTATIDKIPTTERIAWCLAAGVAPVNFAGEAAARDAAREVVGDAGALWASTDTGAGIGEWMRGGRRSAWRYWAWVGLPELPAEVQAAADVWRAGGPAGSELAPADRIAQAIAICLDWSAPRPTDRDQIVQRLGLLAAAADDIRAVGVPDALAPATESRRDPLRPALGPGPASRRDSTPPATGDGRPLMPDRAAEAAGRLAAIASAATEADAGWAGLRAVAETLAREGPRSPYARLIRALVSR
jgi:hypothetical protein